MNLNAGPNGLQRRTIRDEIYERLRDEIVSGALPPNEPLNDTDLQARFGVSRTPIREALQRLVALGLVEVEQQRFTRVAAIDMGKQRERAVAAKALICEAAFLAATVISDEQLAQLRGIAAKLLAIPRAHLAGHRALAAWCELYANVTTISGNATIEYLVRASLLPHLERTTMTEPLPDDLSGFLVNYLEALLDAFQQHDGLAAGKLIGLAMENAIIAPLTPSIDDHAERARSAGTALT